jgi:hypothetical protein
MNFGIKMEGVSEMRDAHGAGHSAIMDTGADHISRPVYDELCSGVMNTICGLWSKDRYLQGVAESPIGSCAELAHWLLIPEIAGLFERPAEIERLIGIELR